MLELCLLHLGRFYSNPNFVSEIPDYFIPVYILMWHPVSKVLFYGWINKMGYYSTENEIMPFNNVDEPRDY